MIDKNILRWLIGCPASDINFKGNLEKANLETCIEALKYNLSKKGKDLVGRRIKELSEKK